MWNFLRKLMMNNDVSWCIIGDFNDLACVDDKREGVNLPPWLIRVF